MFKRRVKTTAKWQSPKPKRVKDWSRIPKILGMGMFLTAALVGFTSATNPPLQQQYWVYAVSLVSGTKIAPDDIRLIELVQSENLERYQITEESIIGKQLTRTVTAGELVDPTAWLNEGSELQELTLSFDPTLLPPSVSRGELLDLWIVPQDSAGNTLGSASLTAANLVVADVIDLDSNFSAVQPVTFYVSGKQIATILDAISTGQPYLVRR